MSRVYHFHWKGSPRMCEPESRVVALEHGNQGFFPASLLL